MHAKTYSEITSLAPSSPDRNRRAVYYVQSPSRESLDGEKTMVSFRSTRMPGSLMGSPPRLEGQHSRESSDASRFSGSIKIGRKILPNDVGSVGLKNWKEQDVIEEEGLLEDEELEKGLPRRCFLLAFVLGFLVLFSLFALILWGASKHQKPRITMQSIKFERFMVQAGSDETGVPTDMISVNSTVKFNYQNPAKFFGIHVSSTPLTLSFSQLKTGSGDIKEFYMKRKRDKNVTVTVTGDKIPMYGTGASLSTRTGMTTLPVQLKLEFMVQSRGYVLGKLVKHRFYNKIECSIVFDMKKLNVSISLSNSCTYEQ